MHKVEKKKKQGIFVYDDLRVRTYTPYTGYGHGSFFLFKKNFFILYVRTREGYSTLSVLITYMYSCAVLELSTLHLVICC